MDEPEKIKDEFILLIFDFFLLLLGNLIVVVHSWHAAKLSCKIV